MKNGSASSVSCCIITVNKNINLEGEKKMKKLTLLLSALVLALGILAAGCGGGDKKDEKKQAAATPAPAAKEELLVGTEPSFAPFEFPEKDSKEFTGFDMDLIRAIAKEMGYKKCTIKNMGFDALIPAINAGNIDVSIAGFSITEERKKQVIFSQPYYKSGLAFVVRKDVNDVQKFDDLKGKTIAVQLGTTGALYAEKLKGKGAVVKTYNTSDLACMELKNKGADAVISDLPVLQYFLKNGGSEYAKLAGEPLTAEDYGIVISKKKPELAKEVDKALDALRKNGTYDKLYEKWFGSKPAK
jgi:polar amino acid transport system substrate-binding protein